MSEAGPSMSFNRASIVFAGLGSVLPSRFEPVYNANIQTGKQQFALSRAAPLLPAFCSASILIP